MNRHVPGAVLQTGKSERAATSCRLKAGHFRGGKKLDASGLHSVQFSCCHDVSAVLFIS